MKHCKVSILSDEYAVFFAFELLFYDKRCPYGEFHGIIKCSISQFLD
jgi:hypothetical protein